MALSFGKNKSKSSGSTNQSFNQTSSTSLSPRAWGLLTDRIADIEAQEYQRLDPNAYKEFMNPFQQEVIDATTADIEASRALAANQQRSDLAGASAFGDKRRGIMEAQLAGDYDRTLATTLAGLRSRGFSEAQGIAQGENTNQNAFNADLQRRIDALLSLLGQETTTNSSGTSQGTTKGKTSGFNLGFTYGDG